MAENTSDRLTKDLDQLSDSLQEFLGGLIDTLEPTLRSLEEKMGDLSAFEPPEVLPNGDIIIRRKREPDARTGQKNDTLDL